MSLTIGVIQARTGSKRLPRKVLLKLNGQPVIKWQIERVKKTRNIGMLVLATTKNREDDPLVSIAEESEIQVFRGDSDDVLSRFYGIINRFNPSNIVRITGDCPLFMPDLCSLMLEKYEKQKCDYFSNTLTPTWPDGCDIEIMSANSLHKLAQFKLVEQEKEHVTLGIYKRPDIFRCVNFTNDTDESRHRWTLDDQEDYEFIKRVYANFEGRESEFNYDEVMNLFKENQIKPRFDIGGMRNSALKNI